MPTPPPLPPAQLKAAGYELPAWPVHLCRSKEDGSACVTVETAAPLRPASQLSVVVQQTNGERIRPLRQEGTPTRMCEAVGMSGPPKPPTAAVLEPADVAIWLDTDIPWVLRAIAEEGLTVLGYRSDGVPLLCPNEVRSWLRRPSRHDDET